MRTFNYWGFTSIYRALIMFSYSMGRALVWALAVSGPGLGPIERWGVFIILSLLE